MVPVTVPEKFGPGKSTGNSTIKIWYWYRKIPLEFGTGTGEFPGIFHFLGGAGIGPRKIGPGKSVVTGSMAECLYFSQISKYQGSSTHVFIML